MNAFGKSALETFSLNYLLYTLFFSLLIRAYCCKPATKASIAQRRQSKGLQKNKKIEHLISQKEYEYAN